MSRAFVKESEEIEPLPERSVSSYPNYVTARGQALIETELVRLSSVYAEAQVSADRDGLARRERSGHHATSPSLASIFRDLVLRRGV